MYYKATLTEKVFLPKKSIMAALVVDLVKRNQTASAAFITEKLHFSSLII